MAEIPTTQRACRLLGTRQTHCHLT